MAGIANRESPVLIFIILSMHHNTSIGHISYVSIIHVQYAVVVLLRIYALGVYAINMTTKLKQTSPVMNEYNKISHPKQSP